MTTPSPTAGLRRRSIRWQLALGLIPHVVAMVVLIMLTASFNRDAEENFVSLTRGIDRALLADAIDRDLLELQRAVLAFASEGFYGVLQRTEVLTQGLDQRLDAYVQQSHGVEAAPALERLQTHYADYKLGFADVVQKRADLSRARTAVTQDLLPSLDAWASQQPLPGTLSRSLTGALAAVRLGVFDLLLTSRPGSVEETRQAVQRVTALTASLPASVGQRDWAQAQAAALSTAVTEVTQYNRILLHLVHVVLAGKAAEMQSITAQLRNNERTSLTRSLQVESEERQRSNFTLTIVTLIATVIAIAVSMAMAMRVAAAIGQIAHTLSAMAGGEYEHEIPYTDRRDEVGDMSRAAQEFSAQARELEVQTNRLAESNAELERFAYVCSHDLQEPLRMVRSFSSLLTLHGEREQLLDDKAREYLGHLNDGAERAQTLIRDVLDYSRAGRGDAARETVDLNTLLAPTFEGIRTAIEERGGVLDVGQLPTLSVRPSQIIQLFQNLCSNAAKFCRQAPEVVVRASRDDHGWHFVIGDNGIGIPPAQQGQIFAPFVRLEHRGEFPGSGIGLSICARVVKSHGGRIWVDSAPGRGTEMHFTLPDATIDT
ncbi:MAG: ATP-binding protein [Pseudomonadota bacterium]|nr:ATP-binding protein [Pseudomonadota bacterium]